MRFANLPVCQFKGRGGGGAWQERGGVDTPMYTMFLALNFSYYTLMTFLMMLYVILLSMLMMLYFKCDHTSDLCQQIELASELESDLRDTGL